VKNFINKLNMTLSKSLYTRAIQCPKSLWLKKYKPEVSSLPDEQAKANFRWIKKQQCYFFILTCKKTMGFSV